MEKIFEWKIDTPVETIIFEALGAASMCWETTPSGVFDSERAKQIGDEVMEMLKAKLWVQDD